MNKKLLFLLAFIIGSVSVLLAKPITAEQARIKAERILSPNALRSDTPLTLAYVRSVPSSLRSSDAKPLVYYYIFNKGTHEGFAVIAGDDRLYEVLAYSTEGHFDEKAIPDHIKSWFSCYDKQIEEFYRTANASTGTQTYTSGLRGADKIDPLLEREKIRWGQTYPYNSECPIVPRETKQAVTGCVATALSQIMRFHKWPTRGMGEVTYQARGIDGQYTGAYYKVTFDHDYDWANMPGCFEGNVKPTEIEAKAIGTLLKDVGMAIKMSYSSYSSGAFNWDVLPALRNNLRYNKEVRLVSRSGYTAQDWANLILDELKKECPVFYTGRGVDGSGHAFLCDGYNGEGFFHFNWGWDGLANGFYRLEALNPTATGTGAGLGSYNMTQEILVGLSPDRDGSSVDGKLTTPLASVRYTHTKASKRLTLKVSLYQGAYESQGYYFKPAVYNGNGEAVYLGSRTFRKLSAMNNTVVSLDFDYGSAALADGRYRITPLWSAQSNGTYEPCAYMNIEPLSIYVTISNKEVTKIEYDVPEIPLTAEAFVSEKSSVKAYSDGTITLKFKNSSDREYYAPVTIFLGDAKQFPSDPNEAVKQLPLINAQATRVVVVPANSEKEETFNFTDCNFAKGEKLGIVAQIPRVYFQVPSEDGSGLGMLPKTKAYRIVGGISVIGTEYTTPILVSNVSSAKVKRMNGACSKVYGPTFKIKNEGVRYDVQEDKKLNLTIRAALLNPANPSMPVMAISHPLEQSIGKGETIEFTPEFDGNKDFWIGYKRDNLLMRLIAVEERDQRILLTSKRKVFGPNLGFVEIYYDTDAAEIASQSLYCHSYQAEGITTLRYGSPTPLTSLDLFDLNGRIVRSFNLASSCQGEVQAEQLPIGSYIVSLRNNSGKAVTTKITVTR